MLDFHDPIPAATRGACRALVAQEYWYCGERVTDANVLFLQVEDGVWHRFFIDAGVVFWKTVDGPEPPEDEGDHRHPLTDLADRHGLTDRHLIGISTVDLPRGGEIRLDFEGGQAVILRNVNDNSKLVIVPDEIGTKTHVYFGVFDFGDDPGIVSGLMGMEPTRAWAKGDRYSDAAPNARHTHSRWTLSSGLAETKPVEAHLAALLTRLEAKRAQIRDVAARFPTRIGVAQYFYEVNPQFCIEADILKRFADLGLPINFDQYCLGEDEGS